MTRIDPRALRTQVASRQLTLAERIEGVLEAFPVGRYRAEVSLAEGSASLHHIRLVPPEPQGVRYIVGSVDEAQRTAQLLPIERVNQDAAERFGAPSDLDANEYLAFLGGAARCFQAQEIAVKIDALSGGGGRGWVVMLVALGVLLVAVLGGIVAVLVQR